MSIEAKFFYANSLEAAVSAYDVSLKFMRNATGTPLAAATTSGSPTAIQTAVVDAMIVSMSPSHAKAMLPALLRLVREYETLYGKIPLAADMQATWDGTFATTDVVL